MCAFSFNVKVLKVIHKIAVKRWRDGMEVGQIIAKFMFSGRAIKILFFIVVVVLYFYFIFLFFVCLFVTRFLLEIFSNIIPDACFLFLVDFSFGLILLFLLLFLLFIGAQPLPSTLTSQPKQKRQFS